MSETQSTKMTDRILISDEQKARDILWEIGSVFAHKRGGDSIMNKCVNADTSAETFYNFTSARRGILLKNFIGLVREFGYEIVLVKREGYDE